MSRVGQNPVVIPQGVTIELQGNHLLVNGPRGKLAMDLLSEVKVEVTEGKLTVFRKREDKFSKSAHGLTRALINNMVLGVTEGWKKQLELVGTGYRSEVQGNKLVLTVGYSHPVEIIAPDGITFKVEKSVINVDGIDKQVVGQVSANIRSSRPPEPYKGKGVKYVGEYIRRKAGKAAKAAA